MQEEELGTFYLTDFLARHFESLIVRPASGSTAPRAAADYFGNYRRLVYLAQTDDADLTAARAGRRRRASGSPSSAARTGYGELSLARSSTPSHVSRLTWPELTVIWWRDIPAQVRRQGTRRRREQGRPPSALPGGDRQGRRRGPGMSEYRRRTSRSGGATAGPAATTSRPRSTAEAARLERRLHPTS